MSVFLKSEEISQIRHAMNQMQVSRIRKRSEVAPIEDDNFKQYFSQDNFFLWTKGDKTGLLEEMAESLSVDESVDFKQSLLYEIKQREALSSVVFSKKSRFHIPLDLWGKKLKSRLLSVKNLSLGIVKAHIFNLFFFYHHHYMEMMD